MKYRISARHRKGFGIHSPFMFCLITKIFRNKQFYPEYELFEETYGELKSSEEVAASGESEPLSIRKYLFRNELRLKYGKLLFRIIRYFQPDVIWFHGRTRGMNLLYMQQAMVYCPMICSGAAIQNRTSIRQLLRSDDTKMDYSNDLNRILTTRIRIAQNPFIFINDPTSPEEIFSIISALCTMKIDKMVILVKAIHSSAAMEKTWASIRDLDWTKNNPFVTVDLYLIGLLIFDTRLQKQDYVVNF